MSPTQMPFDEIRHLRRSLREIVALSTLPAVWTGDEPRTIGEGLAEGLKSLLRLEFVYVRIQLAPDTEPAAVLRADHNLDVAHRTREVGRALTPWLKATGAPPPSSIPNPLGSGMVRIAAIPLGYAGEYGLVVTASRQEDFPTELDRLLLSVGANQAATALQGACLLAALRQADRLKDDLLAREQAARAEAEAARTQVMTILERVTDAFIALDREWRLTYLNRAAVQVLRKLYKTPQALIGANLWEEFPELRGSTFEQEWHRAAAEQATVEFEAYYPPLNAWLEVHAYPSTDGLSVYFQDITMPKRAEGQLQASLKEKEVLLQEIHHRVKNNMQVISSLLNLQAGYSHDPAILALIEDSQQRIQSMALIHESLYRSRDLGHINFGSYLQALADELWRAYRVEDTHIRLHLDAEEVYLDIDKATPCGLLLNELIANCLKHAFPPGRAGDVYIGLQTTPERWVRLVVRDTGCGFPQDIDFRHTDSLGLQLVTSLTEQLQGTITLEQQGGTTFMVTFPA